MTNDENEQTTNGMAQKFEKHLIFEVVSN
jgi:hypothetical protein